MRISSGSSTATTSRSRLPEGRRSASTSRVEYGGATGSLATRSAYSREELGLSPRVASTQLALAQTANTVIDQFVAVAVTSRTVARYTLSLSG